MAQPRRKPSERPKRRYIVFEVATNEPLSMQQVDTALQHALHGLKDKGMRFVQDTWDGASKQGIVRVHHSSAGQLGEMLTSLTTIGNASVSVKTLGTSGILRQAKLKFMKNKKIKKENKRNYHHRV